MNLRNCLVVLGVIFGLTAGASTAQAGKGVKKNGKNAEHHHHGVVTSVEHKKGHFEIVTHHKSKKKKAGAVNGVTTTHHKFTVTASTKFYIAHKDKTRTATTFAHLHKGEHVTISSKNGHADSVVIHPKHKKKKKK
jgi:hypothetical protein